MVVAVSIVIIYVLLFVDFQINGLSVSLDGLLWLNRDLQLQNLGLDHIDLGASVSASVTFLSGPDFSRTHTADLVTLSGNLSISGHKDFGVVKVNSLVVSGTSKCICYFCL